MYLSKEQQYLIRRSAEDIIRKCVFNPIPYHLLSVCELPDETLKEIQNSLELWLKDYEVWAGTILKALDDKNDFAAYFSSDLTLSSNAKCTSFCHES